MEMRPSVRSDEAMAITGDVVREECGNGRQRIQAFMEVVLGTGPSWDDLQQLELPSSNLTGQAGIGIRG